MRPCQFCKKPAPILYVLPLGLCGVKRMTKTGGFISLQRSQRPFLLCAACKERG